MALEYRHLDARTRELMLDELRRDRAAGNVYISNRLTTEGARAWLDILAEAFTATGDEAIARSIRQSALLVSHIERRNPRGGTSMAALPDSAADMLAEGEFNRYYIRAICRRAIEDGIAEVEIFRARHSDNPREDSERLIGQRLNAQQLLEDLRRSQGVEPALGIPRPNSGLSAYIPGNA